MIIKLLSLFQAIFGEESILGSACDISIATFKAAVKALCVDEKIKSENQNEQVSEDIKSIDDEEVNKDGDNNNEEDNEINELPF